MSASLLDVQGLTVSFRRGHDRVRVVEDLSFAVGAGASVGMVGESGCGKSVTSLAILRLLPDAARIEAGSVHFRGQDLVTLPDGEMQQIRGAKLAMVFQDAMSALHPVYPIGQQIAEALRLHQSINGSAARRRAIELLELVGIAPAEQRVDSYPHELSGGMCQRVMIAMALACSPKLLIADEPTTALDVTVQAQILALLQRLRHELGMSLLLISHDLSVMAQTVDELLVMYAGRLVERAPTAALLQRPLHPYTRGLLASLPRSISGPARQAKSELPTIPGGVPDLAELPRGCRFQNRCPDVQAICRGAEPPLQAHGNDRWVACYAAGADA